ncbi:hypothetical protein [Paenilisteria rocourtiae]|uniref:PH (Pleckstrin Homology) domain-containing protein n=1 Tax=Listeria rocourtiae TaxID=647910 RepID=A0A4R6ZJ32_9LIST|nr:hypothetical protein [Listeria rocourtiae]EUJ47697.1 hypothetical protein PROCOU_07943 [Listeria rocourtiae FSL F6-920]MBC1435497.1 hypothetical protein [Listeria rocourtiae]MBC1604893.1 hypothetical protein [Listeria rocourtiae]TDR51969.1 hypothetical protein DFP96_11045 [Listeria rocourtiae]
MIENFGEKIASGEKAQFKVNHLLVISSSLLWIAIGLLLYVVFDYVKAINGTEKLILLIFIGFVVLRPLFRLLNLSPTLELSMDGIAYRGDFQAWSQVEDVKIVIPSFKLFSQGRMLVYTKIKDKREMAWDIVAADVNMPLADLEILIEECMSLYKKEE